jgi:hypothetical protein
MTWWCGLVKNQSTDSLTVAAQKRYRTATVRESVLQRS